MNKKISIFLLLFLPSILSAQTLIKDIFSGTGDGNPTRFVSIDSIVFFIANDSIHGFELWKTDGTTSGTEMVCDINPGISNSLVSGTTITPLVSLGNHVYFFAIDTLSNGELWGSDGTYAGTHIIKDINPGTADATHWLNGEMIVNNGELFFRANNGVDGAELWKSDGTSSGTVMVKNINPSGSGYPFNSSNPSNLFSDGNLVYFSANDNVNGYELWKSDGTIAGTVMIKDIYPGSNASAPIYLTKMNGKIYFGANELSTGYELHVTDGSVLGTHLVKDIFTGSPIGLVPGRLLFAFGNKLLFWGEDLINGKELWISDGTEIGTFLLKDIYPGNFNSEIPSHFCLYNGKVFFCANDGVHDKELWSTDGSASGTSLFLDINSAGASWNFANSINANGKMYFNADDGLNGNELWNSDGTIQGTQMLNQICASSCYSSPLAFFQNGNTLYFSATETNTGRELYKLDLPETGIEEKTNSTFTLFPNPTTSAIYISSSNHPQLLIIRNILGEILINKATNNELTSIDVSRLSSGIYFLEVITNGERTVGKFVKE